VVWILVAKGILGREEKILAVNEGYDTFDWGSVGMVKNNPGRGRFWRVGRGVNKSSALPRVMVNIPSRLFLSTADFAILHAEISLLAKCIPRWAFPSCIFRHSLDDVKLHSW
jgi:hypothetical protein